MSKYYAHSLINEPQTKWQKLEDHLINVAKLAHEFAESFNAGDWAGLIGLFHDIGKYSKEFQERLALSRDNNVNNEIISGRPDHSTAGAQEINRLYNNGFGRMMAYAVAGHHSGLLDGKANETCLENRLKKDIHDYSAFKNDILPINNKINSLPIVLARGNKERIAFQLQFFIRMLFSCLVDADFLDTESFMNKEIAAKRGHFCKVEDMEYKLEQKINELSLKAPDSKINRLRKEILRQCIEAAEDMPGIFSLTVPTGGGKTLSSIYFAIKHAKRFSKKRIIYVIPYTSIIEQNAAVFRDIFGNNSVLEHHSSIEIKEDDYESRLAIENWDAPLIITTNVQFFESLFHNRSSRCRRIHNIANSIVIFDEVQMLPVNLLKPCIETIRELADSYNTTILLCTATQPALKKNNEFSGGLENVREIISDPDALYERFKRVKVEILPDIIDDIQLSKKIQKYDQILCVVNTRRHARELFEQIADKDGLYHLSALMCPAHRSETIKKIKQDLKEGKKCRVISTQLIEAGVDIDFPVVFRAASGIDSIAQSAGRCNREGKKQLGKVFVFNPEKLPPPGYLRQGADEANTIIRRFKDFLSLRAVNEYFRNLYWINEEKLDKNKILEQLSEEVAKYNFPFKKVAGQFHIIDNNMESIIVPFNDDAKKLIRQIRYSKFSKDLARRSQKYSVQIYPQILKELENRAVEKVQENLFILTNEDLYKNDIGLNYDNPVFREIENTIF
jgi:CRISPR-associated endonuclease/helicase Cas3